MLLERYGPRAAMGVYRTHQWQRRLRTGQLQVGHGARAGKQRMHQHRSYSCWQDSDGCNVGKRNWSEAKHPLVPLASWYATRACASSRCRIYRRDSGVCSRASMCGVWGVFHPATCASCGWTRDLLLSSVSRKGAPPHLALLGWHGQRRAWAVRKMDELDALGKTIMRLDRT